MCCGPGLRQRDSTGICCFGHKRHLRRNRSNPKEVPVHPVKVTNALSIDFYVASYRDGKCSWAKYSKGNLLEKGIEKTTEDNGIYIKFVPDPEVFTGYAFQEAIVKDILKSTARQNKGLSISLNGAIVPASF